MSERISRRSFAKLLGVGAAGTLIRPSFAQDAVPATAAKLDGQALDLYRAALRGNVTAAAGRLRFELPENSEPCTVFAAEVPKK
ncbi:MAG: hypothetical protein ABIV13_02700 [Fimbriimonadales bacterium]